MNNFFENDSSFNGKEVVLYDENYKHISKVLRMSVGEKISICNKDNNERYLSEIISIDSEKVICRIIDKLDSNEMNVNITLYQGIPKFDKMEFIIQKSVELGVYEIIPLEMKNCIAKIKDEDKKINRWQLISESAAKQSKRSMIPNIGRSKNIHNIAEDFNKYDLVLLANENEKNKNIKQIISNNKNVKNIAIIVGPEGGISVDEAEFLERNGAISVSIGKRILRCETAPLVLLSMISYEFEL